MGCENPAWKIYVQKIMIEKTSDLPKEIQNVLLIQLKWGETGIWLKTWLKQNKQK